MNKNSNIMNKYCKMVRYIIMNNSFQMIMNRNMTKKMRMNSKSKNNNK